MPPIALAIEPDFSHIFQNPVFVYGNVAVPAPGARLPVLLNAQGIPTPDIAVGASPNAFWLGTSKDGAKVEVTHDIEDFGVNEFEGDVDSRIIKTKSSFSGELYEMLDLERLQRILPNTAYASATGADGYEQITGGGGIILPKIPIAGLSLDPDDETRIIVFQLYSASNKAGLAFPFDRLTRATVPYKFEGYDVVSRPRLDRHWTFWRQKPTA